MPAISSIDASQSGAFVAAITTLTSDDTITFNNKKKQLAVFRNPTGGTLTATIDGSTGTTVTVPGLGAPVDVSSGYAVALTAGQSKAVVLASVSHYLQGVAHITGGAGIVVQLFDF